jgi:hypothetical protein
MYRVDPRSPARIERFIMDSEAYLQHTGSDLVTGQFKTPMLGRSENCNESISERELLKLIEHGAAIRSGERQASDILRMASPSIRSRLAQAALRLRALAGLRKLRGHRHRLGI